MRTMRFSRIRVINVADRGIVLHCCLPEIESLTPDSGRRMPAEAIPAIRRVHPGRWGGAPLPWYTRPLSQNGPGKVRAAKAALSRA